jgi:hypothetical protein
LVKDKSEKTNLIIWRCSKLHNNYLIQFPKSQCNGILADTFKGSLIVPTCSSSFGLSPVPDVNNDAKQIKYRVKETKLFTYSVVQLRSPL